MLFRSEYDKRLKGISGAVGKLGTEIAVSLLPVLLPLTNAVFELVKAFNGLPGPLRGIVVWGATLAVTWGPLTGILTAIVGWFAALGPTIAGWLGIVGPVVGGIIGFLSGLLTFVNGTLLPGLLAVFSGPVGWTVLAIAAVVAMCTIFKEPLLKFAAWLWEWSEPVRKFFVDLWNAIPPLALKAWQAITKFFSDYLITPIRKAWDATTKWLGDAFWSVVDVAKGCWDAIASGLKNAFRGTLQFIADRINQVSGLINQLIYGYNALPNFGDITPIPRLTVPAFAQGGVVGSPRLALVGDGGEREYIVPESKMAIASSRYLAGARGDSVIPSGRSAGAPSAAAGPAQITITTGPVLQQDGQQWVTMNDLERVARQISDATFARQRTPSYRLAVGGR